MRIVFWVLFLGASAFVALTAIGHRAQVDQRALEIADQRLGDVAVISVNEYETRAPEAKVEYRNTTSRTLQAVSGTCIAVGVDDTPIGDPARFHFPDSKLLPMYPGHYDIALVRLNPRGHTISGARCQLTAGIDAPDR